MQLPEFLGPHIALVFGCLGIAQALFLIVYLLTLKAGNRRANVFLALALLGLTIRIGKAVIFNYTYIPPWPRNLGISGFLMAGPFVLFYGRALLGKGEADDSIGAPAHIYLHLAPFFLFVLFSRVLPNDGSMPALVIYTAVLLHLAVYLGMGWMLWHRSWHNTQRRLTSWYRNILSGITLIWVFYVGFFVGVIPFYLLGATAFSFLIYIFAFLFLRRHQFVLEKYAGSSVDLAASRELMQEIRKLFEAEKPFLDADTSLAAIAALLDVQPRILSQAINENENMNFSEFVNHYRIEWAKTLLADPERKSDKIVTIAFDSGFGNLTSFNVAFKSHVNLTPSQYRKQVVSG